MRSFATDVNPAYVRLQQEIFGLRHELARTEKNNRAGAGDIFVPTGKVPEAGLEYVRRLRDVKYYETVFELLAKQFEIAKIDEARDTSLVQVLDEAVVPERKSRPHRARIVVVSAILALLAAIVWALMREAFERNRGARLSGPRRAALRIVRFRLGAELALAGRLGAELSFGRRCRGHRARFRRRTRGHDGAPRRTLRSVFARLVAWLFRTACRTLRPNGARQQIRRQPE
jgi:hypothetical protein